jgi:microcystin-dependent protein
LANFANNLDSSGGVAPSALNAQVPISKGGTNATTAAAARTNLGLVIGTDVAAQAFAVPIGVVNMWALNTAPSGWLICSGAAVSRSTYAALFAIIGTTFGAGDGSTTFNLPDYRDRMPIGAGTTYSANSQGGSKDAVIVSHTHTATVTDAGHRHLTGNGSEGSLNAYYGNNGNLGTGWRISNSGGAGVDAYTNIVTTGITVANSTTGSSGTNANLPPYLGIYFIIKT